MSSLPLPVHVNLKAFEPVPVEYTAKLEVPEGTSLRDILQYIFRQLNRVDGDEWIADKPYRSLSIGDEVCFLYEGELRVYRVESVGWSFRSIGSPVWYPLSFSSNQ